MALKPEDIVRAFLAKSTGCGFAASLAKEKDGISGAEKLMILELARRDELNASDVLRRLVRQEFRRVESAAIGRVGARDGDPSDRP